MGQTQLSGSPLTAKKGGTGRSTLPAAGLLYGLGGGDVLGSLGPGNPGEVVRLKNGQPFSSPGDCILQAVMGTCGTEVQTTSLVSWTPTGLSCSITPLYANSKILVLANQTGVGKYDGVGWLGLSLWRDAINLGFFAYPVALTGEATRFATGTASHNMLDNPATTSPITYSTKLIVMDTPGNVVCQWGGPSAPYGLSTLVLLEVAGS